MVLVLVLVSTRINKFVSTRTGTIDSTTRTIVRGYERIRVRVLLRRSTGDVPILTRTTSMNTIYHYIQLYSDLYNSIHKLSMSLHYISISTGSNSQRRILAIVYYDISTDPCKHAL